MSFMRAVVSATIMGCALLGVLPQVSRAEARTETEKTRPLTPSEARLRDERSAQANDTAAVRARQAKRDSVEYYAALPDSFFLSGWMLAHSKSFSDSAITRASVEFVTETDRFNGVTLTRLAEPITLMPRDYGLPKITLHLVRPKSGGLSNEAWLMVRYSHDDWAFLDGSIELLVDGNARIALSMARESTLLSNRQVRDGEVFEAFEARIPRQTLARLARAHQIELRFRGTRQSVEKWLPVEGLAALRKFNAIFGPPASANRSRAK